MLINKRLEEPYNKMPQEGPLPILSKALIQSKLTKKFWDKVKYIYNSNSNGVSNNNILIKGNIDNEPNINNVNNKQQKIIKNN